MTAHVFRAQGQRRIGLVAVEPTIAKMHNAPRVGGHFALVRDHQHGDALVLVELPQQLHDFCAALAVQVARGLIGQQHGGVGHNRPGNGHALLLAAGQFGRGVVLPAVQPHGRQRLAGGGAALGGAFAPVQQRQLGVFLGAGARQQVKALKDKAKVAPPQPRPLIAVQPLHGHAFE